ncbi:MAG: hypothetical protein PHG80_10670, partial [Methanoregulaceae archaeon]|nr:hypothetical protein [Methanoregulaceae archaeon]
VYWNAPRSSTACRSIDKLRAVGHCCDKHGIGHGEENEQRSASIHPPSPLYRKLHMVPYCGLPFHKRAMGTLSFLVACVELDEVDHPENVSLVKVL